MSQAHHSARAEGAGWQAGGARHKSGRRRDSSAKRLESERRCTQGRGALVGQLGKLRPIGNRPDPEGTPPRLHRTAAVANRRAGCQPAPHHASDSTLMSCTPPVRSITCRTVDCGACRVATAGRTDTTPARTVPSGIGRERKAGSAGGKRGACRRLVLVMAPPGNRVADISTPNDLGTALTFHPATIEAHDAYCPVHRSEERRVG